MQALALGKEQIDWNPFLLSVMGRLGMERTPEGKELEKFEQEQEGSSKSKIVKAEANINILNIGWAKLVYIFFFLMGFASRGLF